MPRAVAGKRMMRANGVEGSSAEHDETPRSPVTRRRDALCRKMALPPNSD